MRYLIDIFLSFVNNYKMNVRIDMKISVKELRSIIREELKRELDLPPVGMSRSYDPEADVEDVTPEELDQVRRAMGWEEEIGTEVMDMPQDDETDEMVSIYKRPMPIDREAADDEVTIFRKTMREMLTRRNNLLA